MGHYRMEVWRWDSPSSTCWGSIQSLPYHQGPSDWTACHYRLHWWRWTDGQYYLCSRYREREDDTKPQLNVHSPNEHENSSYWGDEIFGNAYKSNMVFRSSSGLISRFWASSSVVSAYVGSLKDVSYTRPGLLCSIIGASVTKYTSLFWLQYCSYQLAQWSAPVKCLPGSGSGSSSTTEIVLRRYRNYVPTWGKHWN